MGTEYPARPSALTGRVLPKAAGRKGAEEGEALLVHPEVSVVSWDSPTGLDSGEPRWRR
ncbi:hypothetical protein GCM10009853_031180 [Glycomyces scopariae]